MRIAHWPLNIAGYASRLAEAQRQLGHEVTVYSRSTLPYDFPADVLLPPHTDPVRFNLGMLRWLPELNDFDVLHVHGGIKRFELGYYALRGPKVFVHYHGTETRRGFGLYHQRLADGLFYTPRDLKPYLPESAIWLPQPIDLEAIRPAPEPSNEKPTFVHFVSSEKGEAQIVEMFNHTFPNGEARLRVCFGLAHTDALQIMRRADVVIDQFTPNHGIYGFVSIEAMALGKPVMAMLDHSLYPAGCPIVYPGTVQLTELAENAETRRWYGDWGRQYVEKVHDARKVARMALDAYQQTFIYRKRLRVGDGDRTIRCI